MTRKIAVRGISIDPLFLLHLVNVAMAVVVLNAGDVALPLMAMRTCYLFSLIVAAVTLFRQRQNALFAARTLLLLTPGYFAAGVQLIDPARYYSYYSPAPQTLDISLTLYALTSLAFAGSELGLRLGRVNDGTAEVRPPFTEAIYFFAPIIPVLFMSQYVAWMYGDTLFEASYASGGITGFGSATSVAVVLLFVMFVNFAMSPTFKKGVIVSFCGGVLLVYGMLMRGGRQDVLSCVFGLYVLYWAVKGRGAPIRGGMLLISAPIIVLMEYLGYIRSHVLGLNFDYLRYFREFVAYYLNPGDVVFFGTFSPIASTFSNTVYGVKTGITGFIHGRGYFDYILRTPPEFLYPDRPRDYAWIFMDWKMTSGGGFFELAEAYLNFGSFGAFLVPAAVSFYISRVFHSAVTRGSRMAYFLLFGVLCVLLRGALYQTFAFYRGATVAFVIMLAFEGLKTVLRPKSGVSDEELAIMEAPR